MPTVLDELVVEFRLADKAQLNEDRRALDQEIDKAKESALSFGKTVEQQGAKISEAFGFLKRGAAGILATFVGGEAAAFIDRLATMDAHTNRLARSINVTTRELSVWQNMVRAVGGQPGDVNTLFAGVNDAFMGMAMGNQMPSAPFASLMSRAGVDFRRMSPDVALRQIVQFLSTQPEQQQRFWLQQVPGMNEGAMFLMMDIMRNPEKMRAFREEIEKIGVASDKSAAQAQELQRNTAELNTALDNLARVGFPVLTGIAKALADIIEKIVPDWIKTKENPVTIAPGSPADTILQWFRGFRSDAPISSFTPSATPGSSNPSKAEVEAYIRKSATDHGIDPNIAVAVATGESGLNVGAQGDRNFLGIPTSFGLFQLHRGGLADPYETVTRHSANDPRYWQEQVDFAMMMAHAKGWTPWHAWHGPKWQGINPASSNAGQNKQSSITINGGINVTSSKADPKAVADQIPDAMKRYALLAGANTGLV